MIFLYGPLPPPVHGFSNINSAMFSLISKKANSSFHVFDRKGVAGFAGWFHYFLMLFGFFLKAIFSFGFSTYAGLSGGRGMMLDLPFFFISRVLGGRVFIHHHSFAYATRYSRLAKLLFSIVGIDAVHIVLCDEMGCLLVEKYGLDRRNIRTLSNSAFIDSVGAFEVKCSESIVIGYLSNITKEKGIFEFFDSVEAVTQEFNDLKILVAGPIDPSIRDEFYRRMDSLPYASYVGPVYGANKDSFFLSLDILIFPTKYVNEAEPLVLHEAFRVGVSVLAANKGCIPGMINGHCGCVSCIEDFKGMVLGFVKKFPRNTGERALLKSKISDLYAKSREHSVCVRDRLIEEICNA